MKNRLKIVALLVCMLTISSNVFAQTTIDKVYDISVNELYRGSIQLPQDFPVSSTKFFNIITDSLSHVTVNLFDENQVLKWKIVIIENGLNKTVEYTIFDSNSNVQWMRVVSTVENGKNISNASSSSGRTMKVITSKGENASECVAKIPVSEIEVIVNNEAPKKISDAELRIQKGKSSLPLLINQTEEAFYDTSQLKVLQNVLQSLDELQSMVMERSREPGPQPTAPNCNVFCVRLGTVIPLYHCNSVTLNCNRCGVNSFYIIGGFGCFAICSIPCRLFLNEA